MNVPNGLAHSLVPVEVFGVAGHRGGQAFAANGLAYGKRSPRTDGHREGFTSWLGGRRFGSGSSSTSRPGAWGRSCHRSAGMSR